MAPNGSQLSSKQTYSMNPKEGGLLLDKTANHFFFFCRRRGAEFETNGVFQNIIVFHFTRAFIPCQTCQDILTKMRGQCGKQNTTMTRLWLRRSTSHPQAFANCLYSYWGQNTEPPIHLRLIDSWCCAAVMCSNIYLCSKTWLLPMFKSNMLFGALTCLLVVVWF